MFIDHKQIAYTMIFGDIGVGVDLMSDWIIMDQGGVAMFISYHKHSWLSVLFMVFLVITAASAQFPKLPNLPKDLAEKIPSLNDLIKGEPPITTSLEDAVYEVPFLDGFDPQDFIPMTRLPRTDQGGFIIRFPGLYHFNSLSYCLKAGTYGPSKGDGYLFAPLKGPKTDIVQKIIEGSFVHRDIPQRDIQTLLWAIIARTRISDMSREMQVICGRLLSAKDIMELNGGALGLIPRDKRDEMLSGVSPHIRMVLEAEADLREMMTKTDAAYEDLEQVAVLTGQPPHDDDARYIPAGRWSYHPEGFFIRYFPYSYTYTQIQIYVPAVFDIVKDDRNRITAIESEYGDRLELVYNDAIAPAAVQGDPDVKGYVIGSISYTTLDFNEPGKRINIEWESNDWTLNGIPHGNGQVGALTNYYSDFEARYDDAFVLKQQIELLDKQFRPQDDVRDIMDIGHVMVAVSQIIEAAQHDMTGWFENPVDLVMKAWQYAVHMHEQGGRDEGSYLGSSAKDGNMVQGAYSWKLPVYDPACNEAQPSGQKQRLKMSGVEKDDCGKVQQEIKNIDILLDLLYKWDPKTQPDYDDWSKAAQEKSGGKSPMATDGMGRLVPGEQRGTSGYENDWAKWDALNNKYGGWTDAAEQEFADHIRDTRFKGEPDIVWDAARGHERHHQNTLKDLYGKFGNFALEEWNDPEFQKKEDIAAYKEQKKKLQDWFNKNCK